MTAKLEQYKVFNEAANTLSFSTASRNLFISQSAVSQTISALEKELNTSLFIRKSKGVDLTKEGKLLHEYIKQALDIITTAENQLTNMQNLRTGELVIAAGDTICTHYLANYLEKFHQLYPNIHIKIINRTTIETLELLKNASIDLGFMNLPIDDEGFVVKKCLDVHDIFVSHEEPIKNKVYSYQFISSSPLILLERNSNSRLYVDAYLKEQGIKINPIFEVGSHDLLLQFAQINLGIACVIKEFSQFYLRRGLLYELPLESPIPKRAIGFAYLKRSTLSAATAKFIEMLS